MHRSLSKLLACAGLIWAANGAFGQGMGPTISLVRLSGTNLTLNGSGGTPGGVYHVLTSTNAALSPLTLWNAAATNPFAPDGSFSATIPVSPDLSQEFVTIEDVSRTNPRFAGVFTYHNDNFRTGQNTNEVILTPANVNSNNFGKLFEYSLDANTYASPLYAPGVQIPGKGTHNVVYIVTEHDSVYAFDADGLTNQALWRISFINPSAQITTVPASDTGETGDIQNEIGITSTPVIDPASSTLYLVAKTKEVSGSSTTYVQKLHAMDLGTGAEKFGGPVVIQASTPVPFNSLRENQRSALLLANGVVYLAFASHGDNGPYYGWVLGYDARTLQQTLAYNAAPDGSQAGIWMNGDGPAIDAAGSIFFITGNGSFNADLGGKDYGDSFEKISPAGLVLDFFTPHEQSALSGGDLDLCSGGVLLLPDQPGVHPHLMVSAGKNGTIYLVDRESMGQYSQTSDNVVQTMPNLFQHATGIEGGNFSSPVYFNSYIYFSPVGDFVQAFRLSGGLLSSSPTSRSSQQYAVRGGTLAVSSNGNTNGILWALESRGGGSPGILHAYDALDLSRELYNSNQAGSRDTMDFWQKFTVPVVANGKVYVSSSSKLTGFGLLP